MDFFWTRDVPGYNFLDLVGAGFTYSDLAGGGAGAGFGRKLFHLHNHGFSTVQVKNTININILTGKCK